MKNILIILALFFCITALATENPYAKVDKYAASIGYLPMDELAAKLTVPYHTDSEKVRSIFYWITQHISYDVADFHSGNREMPGAPDDINDSTEREKYSREKYAHQVLTKRKGVCEGYATLLKILCDRAGITCYIISGDGRVGLSDIGRPVAENHTWNAVKINGKCRLIDACWASGYCDAAATRYTKEYKEFYFFTDPALFIYDHFPTDKKWQLLKEPVTPEQCMSYPNFLFEKANTPIISYSPKNGLIKAHIGDTISVDIVLNEPFNPTKYLGTRIDEYDAKGKALHYSSGKKIMLHQKISHTGNTIHYDYKVWSKNVTGLYILYNGRSYLLAYKLEVEN